MRPPAALLAADGKSVAPAVLSVVNRPRDVTVLWWRFGLRLGLCSNHRLRCHVGCRRWCAGENLNCVLMPLHWQTDTAAGGYRGGAIIEEGIRNKQKCKQRQTCHCKKRQNRHLTHPVPKTTESDRSPGGLKWPSLGKPASGVLANKAKPLCSGPGGSINGKLVTLSTLRQGDVCLTPKSGHIAAIPSARSVGCSTSCLVLSDGGPNVLGN